jgi:Tfp pilus assembly protein PilF
MTLPALATVYEHFYRPDRSETSASQKLARYGLLWLVGVAYVLFRIHFFGALAPAKDWPELTAKQILLCGVALVGQYVWKLLWPVRLCAFYVFHPSKSLFDPRVLAGLLVLLALAALFLVCWRSRDPSVHFASFGILWFVATLAPVLNAHLVGVNVFTERYLYLPSIAVAWLVGLGAAKLWSRAAPRPAESWALVLAGVTVGGLFAARIVIRNCDWNNDILLYNRTLDFSPDAYQIQNNLGTVYWHRREVDKAESVWQQALARNPKNPDVLNNLGLVEFERHQYSQAAGYFQRAIELKANLPDPHLNLGDSYMKMGQTALAEPQLRAAVALAPLNSRARDKLGELLAETGRLDEAEEQFRASIRIEPSVFTYDFLGMLDIRRHAAEAAERDFRAALSLDGSDSNAHFGLGHIYKAAGRKAEALGQYQAGLVGDPTDAEAQAAVQKLRQQSAATTP